MMVESFIFSLYGAVAAFILGLLALTVLHSERSIRTAVYFGVGVVLAFIATQLLPLVISGDNPIVKGVGFLVGLLSMMLLHELIRYLREKEIIRGKVPYPLLIGLGLDMFVIGLMIQLVFLEGDQGKYFLGSALAVCASSFVLVASSRMVKFDIRKWKICFYVLFLSLLIPVGTILSYFFFGKLTQVFDVESTSAVLGALLYLTYEEMLSRVKSKEEEAKESSWPAFSLFFGALVVLILERNMFTELL